jgi:hypothetical protein
MKKEFEKLCAFKEISLKDKVNIPADKLNELVKWDLAQTLADMIVNKFEYLPVELTKITDTETGSERTFIRLNVISTDEYARLKGIEKLWDRNLSPK